MTRPSPPSCSLNRTAGVAVVLILFACPVAGPADAADAGKTVGPNACGECHKQEVEAWKGSHHFKTFRDMPRSRKADDIASKLGLKRIKSESRCSGCHFTTQEKNGEKTMIAGISCESCHAAAADWIKVHSSFSGKKAETESKSERQARWKLAESRGMIRPADTYDLAKNCLACHAVPDEELVNKGGHKPGSAFELLSWSQGEVRHNTWHSRGKDNVPANPARRRMLYLVGLGVDLETALRAVAAAKTRQTYAFEMAKRADRARNALAAAAKAAPSVAQIARMVELGHSAGLKLGNSVALTAAADGISKELESLVAMHDGSALTSLDTMLPGPEKAKGAVRPVSTSN